MSDVEVVTLIRTERQETRNRCAFLVARIEYKLFRCFEASVVTAHKKVFIKSLHQKQWSFLPLRCLFLFEATFFAFGYAACSIVVSVEHTFPSLFSSNHFFH